MFLTHLAERLPQGRGFLQNISQPRKLDQQTAAVQTFPRFGTTAPCACSSPLKAVKAALLVADLKEKGCGDLGASLA